MDIQLEFNSNFNGIPVRSNVNQVEISNIYVLMEISMKCQKKLIGYPVKIQWNTNGNPLEIEFHFQWNANGNPLEI